MVNDLNHTPHKKPKLTLSTSKSLDNFSDNSDHFFANELNSINNPTGISSPLVCFCPFLVCSSLPVCFFYTERPNKLRLARFILFPKRQPLSQPTINYRTSTLPPSQEQHPTLPYYSTANTTQNDNLTTQNDTLLDHTSVNDDTDSPIKVYSKTNYPFPPPSF